MMNPPTNESGVALTPTLLIGVLLTVVGLSVGQLLFKMAALRLGSDSANLWTWLGNGPLWAALVTYAASTVAWVMILRALPLSWVYPFAGLAFLIVPLLAWLLLGEPMKANQWLGALIIMAGIWVSTR